MNLSIVLPCFNEEKNVVDVIRSISNWLTDKKIDGEIITVNDGSWDETAAELQRLSEEFPKLHVITHQQNLGYGAAVRSGCDAAKKEWICFMDSDRQFDIHDLEKLIIFTDTYGFITGRRLKRADPFIRKLNAKLFGILSFLVLGIWVRDINCAMKLFHKDVWKKVRPQRSTGALINAEIFYRLKLQNIPWKQVPIAHYPRKYGQQTGAKLKVIVRMFVELFALRTTVYL